jgi:hypothetical protein
MQGKLTLITPPDIYENSNLSILFIHLTDEEQDAVSLWLANNEIPGNVNIYLYNGEPNVSWFLYALSRSDYKYINVDCLNYITQSLSGYVLGKSNTYYKTSDENISAVYSHINSGSVINVEQFLESILSEQK